MDWALRTFRLSPRSLAAMRIGLGIILCCDGILRARDFPLMYSADGLFPPTLLRDYLGSPAVWTVALWGEPGWCSAALLLVETTAGLLLAVGLATRWATLAAWVAVVSLTRRTAPASNAGDAWLGCLLLWSLFVPLAQVWSIDARRRGRRQESPHSQSEAGIFSCGTVALVLQVAAVYLSAGLAKCDGIWLAGDAVTYALSVHNHGTPLGAIIAAQPWLARLTTWLVLAGELAAPCLLLALPASLPRTALVILGLLFHAAIGLTMNVGLFAPVGIVAWLALLPEGWWGRQEASPGPAVDRPPGRQAIDLLCGVCLTVAAISFWHANTPWRGRPLPPLITSAVSLLALEQDWRVFGDVQRQQQWVYSRAGLADGSLVDLLRGGARVIPELPPGGFYSLPNHRWHTLFWDLSKPRQRLFAPAVAAALAAGWNRSHGAESQVVSLELRSAHLIPTPPTEMLHEVLLATWPPRPAGRRDLHPARGQQTIPALPSFRLDDRQKGRRPFSTAREATQ